MGWWRKPRTPRKGRWTAKEKRPPSGTGRGGTAGAASRWFPFPVGFPDAPAPSCSRSSAGGSRLLSPCCPSSCAHPQAHLLATVVATQERQSGAPGVAVTAAHQPKKGCHRLHWRRPLTQKGSGRTEAARRTGFPLRSAAPAGWPGQAGRARLRQSTH